MRRVEITRLSADRGEGGLCFESHTVPPGGSEKIRLSGEGAELIVFCKPNGGSIQIKSPKEEIEVFKFKNLSGRGVKKIDASRGKIRIAGSQGVLISGTGIDVAIQAVGR